MPIFLASLIGALVAAAGSLAGRVLIALGISYVTFTGLSGLLDTVAADVWARLDAVPSSALSVLSALQVDVVVNILLSSLAARLVLRGLTSGAVTRMVVK